MPDDSLISGPSVRPLVPGHLGTPSEEVCKAALTVLGAAEVIGDPELVRAAKKRVRDAGLSVGALRDWGRRRTEGEHV